MLVQFVSPVSCSSSSSCHKKEKCCKPYCPPQDCHVDCKCLTKKYHCNKKNTQVNQCIIDALEFALSKLTSVDPLIDEHAFALASTHDNIKWYENFFETILCVLTKTKFCGCVTFKFYKIKNNEDTISNRQYILRACYSAHGKHHVDIPLFGQSQISG